MLAAVGATSGMRRQMRPPVTGMRAVRGRRSFSASAYWRARGRTAGVAPHMRAVRQSDLRRACRHGQCMVLQVVLAVLVTHAGTLTVGRRVHVSTSQEIYNVSPPSQSESQPGPSRSAFPTVKE